MSHGFSGNVTFRCPDCGTALKVDVEALEEDPRCSGCGETLELQEELNRVWKVNEAFEDFNKAILDNANNDPPDRGGVNDSDLDGLCRLAADHIREGAADGEIESVLVADGLDPERARKIVRGMRGMQSLYYKLAARQKLVRGATACVIGASLIGVSLFITAWNGANAFAGATILYGVISLLAGARIARKGARGDLALLAELGVDPTSIGSLVMDLNMDPGRVARALTEMDKDPGAASYCPRCGAQFCAGVDVCSECEVALSEFQDQA